MLLILEFRNEELHITENGESVFSMPKHKLVSKTENSVKLHIDNKQPMFWWLDNYKVDSVSGGCINLVKVG